MAAGDRLADLDIDLRGSHFEGDEAAGFKGEADVAKSLQRRAVVFAATEIEIHHRPGLEFGGAEPLAHIEHLVERREVDVVVVDSQNIAIPHRDQRRRPHLVILRALEGGADERPDTQMPIGGIARLEIDDVFDGVGHAAHGAREHLRLGRLGHDDDGQKRANPRADAPTVAVMAQSHNPRPLCLE